MVECFGEMGLEQHFDHETVKQQRKWWRKRQESEERRKEAAGADATDDRDRVGGMRANT